MNLQKFLSKFQRITSSKEFIPQIDGLRFISIAAVYMHHLNGKLLKNHTFSGDPENTLMHRLLHHFDFSVPMFFIISGFVLALPFARYHLGINNKKIKLKNYFMRRLTRIEPPYIIVVIGCFLFYTAVDNEIKFREELPHVFAALTYTHNLIFHEFLKVNLVTWTLEVEVQFYLIAPLLGMIFKLKTIPRRILLIALMLLFPLLNDLYPSNFRSLYRYVHYFLLGFLLVDFYLVKIKITLPTFLNAIIGFVIIFVTFYINSIGNRYNVYIHLFLMFIFYHMALNEFFWKRILGNIWLTTIGGMCYTIYLIHFPIQGFLMKSLFTFQIGSSYYLNFFIQFILVSAVILTISGIFFILIEKPCMRKDWYKRKSRSLKVSNTPLTT